MARTTKKKTSKKKAPKKKVKESVPAMEREQKGSAKDMLANLAGSAKSETSKDKKKKRPVLDVPENVKQAAQMLGPIQHLSDLFANRSKSLKSEIKEGCMSAYIDSLWEEGVQPQNPSLAVQKDGKPDVEGTYVVTTRFKVQAETEQQLIDLLESLNVNKERAEKLVQEEIDFTPQIQLRSFNELVKDSASDEEKEVATRLMQFVNGEDVNPLSEDERNLVLTSKNNVEVKKGFLERVCGYVAHREELAAVLSAIQPVEQIRTVKFGLSDSESEKFQRLSDIAHETIHGKDLKEELSNESRKTTNH